jgi:hypothetical protein
MFKYKKINIKYNRFTKIAKKLEFNDLCDNDRQCLGPNMNCLKSSDSQYRCVCSSEYFWNKENCGEILVHLNFFYKNF